MKLLTYIFARGDRFTETPPSSRTAGDDRFLKTFWLLALLDVMVNRGPLPSWLARGGMFTKTPGDYFAIFSYFLNYSYN